MKVNLKRRHCKRTADAKPARLNATLQLEVVNTRPDGASSTFANDTDYGTQGALGKS